MRVIHKTILDKIDEEIDSSDYGVQRIEVSNKEFKDLLDISDKAPVTIFEATSIYLKDDSFSGSYVVYRGVCIQTHISYGK